MVFNRVDYIYIIFIMKTIKKNKKLTNVHEGQLENIQGGFIAHTDFLLSFCAMCACPLTVEDIIDYRHGLYVYKCPECGTQHNQATETSKQ